MTGKFSARVRKTGAKSDRGSRKGNVTCRQSDRPSASGGGSSRAGRVFIERKGKGLKVGERWIQH